MDSEIPQEFLCPLTLEIMSDPLTSKYGHSFERQAILNWLETGNETCPISRKTLSPRFLIPNVSLRLRIRAWLGAQEALKVTGILEEEDTEGGTLSGNRDDDIDDIVAAVMAKAALRAASRKSCKSASRKAQGKMSTNKFFSLLDEEVLRIRNEANMA